MSQRALWSAGVRLPSSSRPRARAATTRRCRTTRRERPVDAAMLDATSTSEAATSQTDGGNERRRHERRRHRATAERSAIRESPSRKSSASPGYRPGLSARASYEDERIAYYSFDKETGRDTRRRRRLGVGTRGGRGRGTRAARALSRSIGRASSTRTLRRGPAVGPARRSLHVEGHHRRRRIDHRHSPSSTSHARSSAVTLHIEKGEAREHLSIAVARDGRLRGRFRRVDVGFGVTGGDTPRDGGSIRDYALQHARSSPDGLALAHLHARARRRRRRLRTWVATRTSLATDFEIRPA